MKNLIPHPERIVPDHFPVLTGVRGLAAFMVYAHHYNPFAAGSYPFKFFYELHTGVTIFFVLSGFLICYRYYNNFAISRPWFGRYLVNRFARIFPVFFLLTTLTFLVEPPAEDLWLQYFLNIALLKGLFNELKFSGIPQGWSLTVEACFYLSAPFIFLLIKKNKLFILILPAGFLALGSLLVFGFSESDFYSFFSDQRFMVYYTFFGRCTEFFAGIALALLLRKSKPATADAKPGFGYLTFLSLFFMGFFLAGLSYFGLFSTYGLIINNVVLPVFIAVFFLGLLTEASFLRRILSSRLAVILGKSSYIFYLVHLGVFASLLRTHLSTNFILNFILLNILSIFLFKFIEAPLNKTIRNFFAIREQLPAAGKNL